MSDWRFVFGCFEDWPLSSKGPVTEQKAVDFVRRWMFRDDEQCRILEIDGKAVGLIAYRVGIIDTIIVHPLERGKGYSKVIMKELQTELAGEGVTSMEFEALPGIIADKVTRGDFEKVAESVGKLTGLPTVIGRVQADTEI